MSEMFVDCHELETLDVSGFDIAMMQCSIMLGICIYGDMLPTIPDPLQVCLPAQIYNMPALTARAPPAVTLQKNHDIAALQHAILKSAGLHRHELLNGFPRIIKLVLSPSVRALNTFALSPPRIRSISLLCSAICLQTESFLTNGSRIPDFKLMPLLKRSCRT